MPLKKSAPKKEKSAARLQRYHTRKAAEEYFGKRAIKGKHIHHRNGNKNDNRKKNLKLIDPKSHGSVHGRGNGGSIQREIKFKLRSLNNKLWNKNR